ncbi:MAG: GSCFA domain-containing protein [Bacteroidales bacterium]|nr:GSCFA domain-containing protein [Bacteroidales bacterium]
MEFRTPISIEPAPFQISHSDRLVMLGSCFTDNVGSMLERDGFDVIHNPMGPLYNPASIAKAVKRALCNPRYSMADLIKDVAGGWHCLDFASRFSDADADRLIERLNADIGALADNLRNATVAVITLGTSWVYLRDKEVVGNCHKFPASFFTRRMLSLEETRTHLQMILYSLMPVVKHVIFTVSPIRHLADGFHANQLSKSNLMIALRDLKVAASATTDYSFVYFPAYEIMMDDLRDYRFYAPDMTHPSEVAVQYIYEKFQETFFSPATKSEATLRRKAYLRSQHRPILPT